ncbi:MAG: hypothetical protein H0T76_29160 [Nannocystis sp.]|nr:PA14 domain-containing protein [Nannocystis sp.]MBA3550564.1 hypothetical protein [Nannocystis sp.]
MTTPTPTPTPSDAQARLAVAARELRAAQAIVFDPSCEDALAATHLTTAWQALALATCPERQAPTKARTTWPERQAPTEAPEPSTAASSDPMTCPEGQAHAFAPRPEDRAALPAALAEAIDAVLPALLAARGRSPFEPAPWTVPHDLLERHIDALARILARHQAPARAGEPWRRRVALGAAALALGLLVLRPWQAENLGPWAGTYYKRVDFSGASTARRDLDLSFEWGDKSPMDELPSDHFSVRWETCLDVPAAVSVPFQLVSDDGSRLYIDDKLALDNWGKHTIEARGTTIDLTPGAHHLRVDYFDSADVASVALLASFDGEAPASLPRAMLSAPEEGDDDDDPCGD